MYTSAESGHPLLGPTAVAGDLLDRERRIHRVGTQVRSGTYHPPLEGVVESLVTALLPHFRTRG